jgi:homoaconitase/3-isopropylmalate dehydratase large subunit
MTIIEKIIAAHAGRERVDPGDYVVVLDHLAPEKDIEAATLLRGVRGWVREQGITAPAAQSYLANPAVAAASAIRGEITAPESVA